MQLNSSNQHAVELHRAESLKILRLLTWPANFQILCNFKIYYPVHNTQLMIPVLGHLIPIHIFTNMTLKYSLTCTSVYTQIPWSASSLYTLYMHFSFSISVTVSPAYLISLDFIILISFGKQNKLRRFSLMNFLHPPITVFLIDPKILSSTVCSKH
jgi:hypothetical protein